MENIELERIRGGPIVKIPKCHYEQIVSLIFSTIEKSPGGVITLDQLIESTKHSMSFHGDKAWYLLQVKQDLVARRRLRLKVDKHRVQFIRAA